MSLERIEIPQFMKKGRFVCNRLTSGLNALTGENGAGKTIFLNILCHYLKGKSDWDVSPLVSRYRQNELFDDIKVKTNNGNTPPCLLLSGEWMRHAQHTMTETGDLLSDTIADNFARLREMDPSFSYMDGISIFFHSINKQLIFGGKAASEKQRIFSIYQLSSGEKKILYILTSVYLMALCERHFVLLADSIEESLHINWCGRLALSLIELCPQILVVTHNPAMLMNLNGKFNHLDFSELFQTTV